MKENTMPKQNADDNDLTRNDEVYEQSIASECTVLLNLATLKGFEHTSTRQALVDQNRLLTWPFHVCIVSIHNMLITAKLQNKSNEHVESSLLKFYRGGVSTICK